MSDVCSSCAQYQYNDKQKQKHPSHSSNCSTSSFAAQVKGGSIVVNSNLECCFGEIKRASMLGNREPATLLCHSSNDLNPVLCLKLSLNGGGEIPQHWYWGRVSEEPHSHCSEPAQLSFCDSKFKVSVVVDIICRAVSCTLQSTIGWT